MACDLIIKKEKEKKSFYLSHDSLIMALYQPYPFFVSDAYLYYMCYRLVGTYAANVL